MKPTPSDGRSVVCGAMVLMQATQLSEDLSAEVMTGNLAHLLNGAAIVSKDVE